VSDNASVASLRYVLTDLGRQALASWSRCECDRQFEGGLLVCLWCGTVYATMADMARTLARPSDWRRP